MANMLVMATHASRPRRATEAVTVALWLVLTVPAPFSTQFLGTVAVVHVNQLLLRVARAECV